MDDERRSPAPRSEARGGVDVAVRAGPFVGRVYISCMYTSVIITMHRCGRASDSYFPLPTSMTIDLRSVERRH